VEWVVWEVEALVLVVEEGGDPNPPHHLSSRVFVVMHSLGVQA
jgi:hypothetical protein